MSERCACGRPKYSTFDLERFNAVAPHGHAYHMAPSVWQLVRLGVCLAPNQSHLDIPIAMANDVCWCVTGDCMLARLRPITTT